MLVAFAGAKQSGKNTCANFLTGLQLRGFDVIDNFELDMQGQLIVEADLDDGTKQEKGKALLDVTRTDPQFVEWASRRVYPYTKSYSFAYALKDVSMGLFGLTHDQCFGNDAAKNSLTELLWENMPSVITDKKLYEAIVKKDKDNVLKLTYHEAGKMSARQFLQYFGTDVCRKIYDKVWIDLLINQIKDEDSALALVTDVRFANEVNAVRAAGGKVIHLLRKPFEDSHSSETSLEGCELDAVIDNREMNIDENCRAVYNVLESWGVFGSSIV